MKRQLWWNFVSEALEQRRRYFFVIINDNREIGVISNRIFSELQPIDELQERGGKAGDLQYKLLVFYSHETLPLWRREKIYKGKQKRDFRLYERRKMGMDGLEEYVQKQIQENN